MDEFYLRIFDRYGNVKRTAFNGFTSLRYRKSLLEGRVDFAYNPTVTPLDLAIYDQVEVWRRNLSYNIPWHRDHVGIYRDFTQSTDDNGITTRTAKCPNVKEFLRWRIVAYPATINNRSSFTNAPTETIAKTVVTYNCTAAATVADGRIRGGDLLPGMGILITVAPDQGRGEVLPSKAFAHGNVWDIVFNQLAAVAGGDFDIYKAGDTGNEYIFEFYPGQLGTDKSSGSGKVEFSLSHGDILRPTISDNRLDEATVAIVGGGQEGPDRTFVVVTGPDYAPDNDIEMFVDARNESDDGLEAVGQEKLEERRARRDGSFEVLQTPHVFYSSVPVAGKYTYDVGDLVAYTYDGETVQKIMAVEIYVTPEDQSKQTNIYVEMESV